MEKIKKGSLVIITSGEYSDYTIRVVGTALQDMDADALLNEYLEKRSEEREEYEYEFNYDGFLAFLLQKKVIVELPYAEFNLGAYQDARTAWVANNP